MTEFPNSAPASNAEPACVESAPDQNFGLSAGPDGASGGPFEMNDEADLGGHTLLARSPAAQGRRSLFRR